MPYSMTDETMMHALHNNSAAFNNDLGKALRNSDSENDVATFVYKLG